MNFTNNLEKLLKSKNESKGIRRIGFIEGGSLRMIAAAKKLQETNILEPVMLFETRDKFEKANIGNLSHLIIEEEKELLAEVFEYYSNRRKDKETKEQLMADIKKTPYFGSALVAINKLNGAIGGVHFSSSDILRSAFKVIGPAEGVKTISSVMLMHKEDMSFIFSDISVNINPNANQLVDIAWNACEFAKSLEIDSKVAFLSFSTEGSAAVEQSIKIKEATDKFNETKNTQHKAIGEIQFDAAFDLKVRSQKYKAENFDSKPTIFVFPDLNSGNIGYKIAQRMGSWGAIGPILTGVKKPINDLSRGATTSDIEYTAILTSLQSFK